MPEGSLTRYMTMPSLVRGTRAAGLSLVALEALPCGCIAGVYRARPTIVQVDVVEAKGPHCLFHGHRAGQVTSLGVPDQWQMEGGEPLV